MIRARSLAWVLAASSVFGAAAASGTRAGERNGDHAHGGTQSKRGEDEGVAEERRSRRGQREQAAASVPVRVEIDGEGRSRRISLRCVEAPLGQVLLAIAEAGGDDFEIEDGSRAFEPLTVNLEQRPYEDVLLWLAAAVGLTPSRSQTDGVVRFRVPERSVERLRARAIHAYQRALASEGMLTQDQVIEARLELAKILLAAGRKEEAIVEQGLAAEALGASHEGIEARLRLVEWSLAAGLRDDAKRSLISILEVIEKRDEERYVPVSQPTEHGEEHAAGHEETAAGEGGHGEGESAAERGHGGGHGGGHAETAGSSRNRKGGETARALVRREPLEVDQSQAKRLVELAPTVFADAPAHAIRLLDRVATWLPGTAIATRARLAIAQIERKLGRYERALAAARAAAPKRASKEAAEAAELIATVLLELKRPVEAITAARAALIPGKPTPFNAGRLHLLIAQAFLASDAPLEALLAADVAAADLALRAEGLIVAAKAYEALGLFEDAEGAYRRAASHAPVGSEAWARARLGAARTARALGRPTRAKTVLEPLFDHPRWFDAASLEAARALSDRGELEPLLAHVRFAAPRAASDETRRGLLELCGDLALKLGRFEIARKAYRGTLP